MWHLISQRKSFIQATKNQTSFIHLSFHPSVRLPQSNIYNTCYYKHQSQAFLATLRNLTRPQKFTMVPWWPAATMNVSNMWGTINQLCILSTDKSMLLNKISELVTKCGRENMFFAANQKQGRSTRPAWERETRVTVVSTLICIVYVIVLFHFGNV